MRLVCCCGVNLIYICCMKTVVVSVCAVHTGQFGSGTDDVVQFIQCLTVMTVMPLLCCCCVGTPCHDNVHMMTYQSN